MTIGERIKILRKKNDLTQEKLADYLGVSYQAVSKWECGASSPDLSLIVPLAKLLHVTTDELLGMVDAETDARKLEYDALYNKAHHPEQLELAQQASREYPTELKYINWQADCLFLLASQNYSTLEKFHEDLEKSLKLFCVVFERTTDTVLKYDALASIVMTLVTLKRHDEAKKYAEMYPSNLAMDKDTVMNWALTGEEKHKHSQQMLMHYFDGMLRILITSDCPEPKKIEYLDCAEKIIKIMLPSGEYNRYYDDLMDISVYKALNYASADPQKSVEELKKAREYAQTFDELFMHTPTAIPYHSPYFDLLDYDSADMLVYGPLKENKRIDNFNWWLTAVHFDALRERSDFQELLHP